jgi:hypothetical protein
VPVDASTPEGTSTERIGAPDAFVASITAAASSRGSPRKPVPKRASTTTSAPAGSLVSSASRPASRRIRAAIRPSPPLAPLPQMHAKRVAAGNRSSAASATARPARSISSPTS